MCRAVESLDADDWDQAATFEELAALTSGQTREDFTLAAEILREGRPVATQEEKDAVWRAADWVAALFLTC
jgi:hypothetical protein